MLSVSSLGLDLKVACLARGVLCGCPSCPVRLTEPCRQHQHPHWVGPVAKRCKALDLLL